VQVRDKSWALLSFRLWPLLPAEESVSLSRSGSISDSGGFTSYPDKNWKMLLIFVGVTIQHLIATVEAMLTTVHPIAG